MAKININTANRFELEKLPGIGPKKAERIIKYRLEHGKFKRVEDIVKVKGIGKKTLERLRPHITVDYGVSDEVEGDDCDIEGKININLADIDDFSIMPGIGKKKKIRIMEYRKKYGNFNTKEDIMNVKGIGEKIFEKISVFITVKIDLNRVNISKLRRLKGINQKFVDAVNLYRINHKKITKKRLDNLLKNFKDMKKFKHFFCTF